MPKNSRIFSPLTTSSGYTLMSLHTLEMGQCIGIPGPTLPTARMATLSGSSARTALPSLPGRSRCIPHRRSRSGVLGVRKHVYSKHRKASCASTTNHGMAGTGRCRVFGMVNGSLLTTPRGLLHLASPKGNIAYTNSSHRYLQFIFSLCVFFLQLFPKSLTLVFFFSLTTNF
jgi:hypothetical protein